MTDPSIRQMSEGRNNSLPAASPQRRLLEDIRGFLVSEGPVLKRWPELFRQQAANRPRSSVLAEFAARKAEAGDGPRRPWLRWINRPEAPDAGPLFSIPAHAGEITALAFSADGDRLISAALDGTVAIWDAGNGREIARIAGVRRIEAQGLWASTTVAVISVGGGRIAAARESGIVTIHRDTDGVEVASLRAGPGDVSELVLSADGSRLALEDQDAITVWDLPSRGTNRRLSGSDCAGLWAESGLKGFGPTPDMVVYGYRFRVRDLRKSEDRPIRWLDLDLPADVLDAVWNWNGPYVLTPEPDRFSWDHRENASASRSAVFRVARGEKENWAPGSGFGQVLTRDGRLLVAADLSRIALMDLTTCDVIAVLAGTNNWDPTTLWISPEGDYLLVSGKHGELETWDLKTGCRVHEIETYKMRTLAFHPDGRQAVFCSWPYADPYLGIRGLDVEEGKLLGVLAAHAAGVTSLAFSGDGGLLVSGDADGRIIVWDYRNAPYVSEAHVMPRRVAALAFEDSGRRLSYRVEAEKYRISDEALARLGEEAGLGWRGMDSLTGREIPSRRAPDEPPEPPQGSGLDIEPDFRGRLELLRGRIPDFGEIVLAFDASEGTIEITDCRSGRTEARFPLPERPAQVAFSTDLIAVGGASKGRIYLLRFVPAPLPP